MEKREILCIDCKKYFPDINSFNEEHNKPLYKVLKKLHSFIHAENILEYIYNLNEVNTLLGNEIKKQQKQIKELSKRLELVEDINKNIFLNVILLLKMEKLILKI